MPKPHLILTEARSWIGTPYRHQASLKVVGCDCLGLLRGVWRGVMGQEPELPPPYSADWAEAGADTLVAAARRSRRATCCSSGGVTPCRPSTAPSQPRPTP